ncbi:MAG: AmmeMemoRadiSam system protein B [Armatimonadota bacterium]|nr:MAG: AmmeMemoRadiSam system protein B [Armatimonadota bacterium]
MPDCALWYAAMPDDRPKLRPLDLIPVGGHGAQQFLLRDPRRLSAQEIVVPADLAYLLTQFDGTRTVREAQVNYVRRFGSLLTSDKINDLLARLDEALFLDSERFRQFAAEIEADFRARPTRPASHAGQSYEEGAGAFVTVWQPRLAAANPPQDFALDAQRPALIAPHYDMNAAAECYAAAYALLAETERPEVVIILGIAHSGGAAPFTLTRKPFETPFGALETDSQMIESLAGAAPFDLFADEFLHRDEHSIEFQAVLLHFLYHEGEPPKIVPILCASYHRSNGEFADPAQPGPTNDFLDALRQTLAGDARRVGVVASADLSHIGARFGQPPPLAQAHLDMARRHDTALLEKAQAGDAEGLCEVLAGEQDRYNVCGFPAIYALLRALPVKEGRVLSYRQATQPQTQSCVSFASVGLRPIQTTA